MDTPRIDRRHPRISVDQLRRDLRDADEDRYRLTAALNAQRSWRLLHPGTASLWVLIAAAIGSAMWVVHAPAAQGRSASAPQQVDVRERSTSAPQQVDVREIPAAPPEAPRVEPPRARARPAAARTHRTTTRTPVRRIAEPARRHVPRPLSPGEFGRAASN
jgi:hypothetical protein